MTIPYGAREIIEVRANGKRPADMVLVSFVGPLRDEGNPQIIAKPNQTYDWRFLARLDVLAIAASTTPGAVIKRQLDAILGADPEYIGLWLADKQTGINVSRGGWRFRAHGLRPMLAYERGLYSGLGASCT